MSTEYINGIACRAVETRAGKKVKSKGYGAIPLAWLKNLRGDSGKAKIVGILWFLNGVKGRDWFSISAQMRREYGLSQSQTNKILTSFEESGHVKLQRSPGKAFRIKLIKPPGWK